MESKILNRARTVCAITRINTNTPYNEETKLVGCGIVGAGVTDKLSYLCHMRP